MNVINSEFKWLNYFKALIDTLNIAHYPLPAGLHCQLVLTDQSEKALKEFSFSVYPCVPPLRWNGRGTPSGVLGFFRPVCQPLFVLPP